VTPARVALATCSAVPDLDDDERLVIPALAALGVDAVPLVWDDPSAGWAELDLVVVRSTWDYSDRRDEFLRWGASLRGVLNPLPVLTWNTDKVYLRELAAAGIAVVPTVWIEADSPADSISLPAGDVVVKPAVSAGARNTSRYHGGEEAAARSHVERLVAAGRTVMVQPYVASVDRAGETALIFLDASFSHSVRKGPLLRGDRVTEDLLWVPEEITARDAAEDELVLAERALDAVPFDRDDLLYARVDVVRGPDGTPMVLEVELAEPSLFLAYGETAATRLAAGIARRLRHG
jgi:glutathione synthase/RimK-type ligase-like ATP-grasp enzyme